MVALDFFVANTESDKALTILAMKKTFQSTFVTVMHDLSAIEFAATKGTGYFDFWEHQEIMFKCYQGKSMKRIVVFFSRATT